MNILVMKDKANAFQNKHALHWRQSFAKLRRRNIFDFKLLFDKCRCFTHGWIKFIFEEICFRFFNYVKGMSKKL